MFGRPAGTKSTKSWRDCRLRAYNRRNHGRACSGCGLEVAVGSDCRDAVGTASSPLLRNSPSYWRIRLKQSSQSANADRLLTIGPSVPPHVGKSPPTTSSPQTAADRCVQGTVCLREGGQEGRLFGGDVATECCERSEPGDVMGAEPPSKGSFGMRPEGAITKVRFSSLRTGRSENKKPPSRLTRGFRKAAAAYSPTWCSSTIGASELNFSVRYGKRWILTAITTAVYYLREILLTKRIPAYGKISGY